MKNNKEIQLLTSIGKATVRYMDYIALLFIFPFIFDVKVLDPKVFIAIGALIVIRAVMPFGYSFCGIDEAKTMVVMGNKGTGTTTSTTTTVVQVKQEGGEIKHKGIVDATNLQRAEIRFEGKGEKPVQINTKRVDGDFMLISFPDFRTLKLHKNEIEQAYIALLESEYGFFKPGKWYVEIKVKNQL